MKRLVPLALAIVLLATALPALAATDGYPDNILLDTGIAYGNYGYPGLVALHGGDTAKINAHIHSAKANQQGGGTGYRPGTAAAAAPALSSWQIIIRDELNGNPNFYWGDVPMEAAGDPYAYLGKGPTDTGYFSLDDSHLYYSNGLGFEPVWPIIE